MESLEIGSRHLAYGKPTDQWQDMVFDIGAVSCYAARLLVHNRVVGDESSRESGNRFSVSRSLTIPADVAS